MNNTPGMKPIDRRVRELVLFNPWTASMHIYKLDASGLRLLRKLPHVVTDRPGRKAP